MNSKKLIAVILLVLLFLAMPIQAFAKEAVTAEIPFAFKNASGTVVVEALHNEPLPAQTEFEGVSEGNFTFSFTDTGDYYYIIYQKQGTDPNVTYDSTVYDVCVSVFINENGELYSVSAINEKGSSEKTENVVFENISSESGSEPNEEPNTEPRTEPNEEPSTEPASESNRPSDSDPFNAVQTGDNNNLGFWIVLLSASLLGLAWFYLMRKKTK